jgi:hypothetical protein
MAKRYYLCAMIMYPTPSATLRGAHTGKIAGAVDIENRSRTSGSGVTWGATLQTVVGSGVINPEWEEWLMGWPIGWTGLAPLKEERMLGWEADPSEATENPIPRVKRCPDRAKRVMALGNGQVPQCFVMAWYLLTGQLDAIEEHKIKRTRVKVPKGVPKKGLFNE